MPLPNGYMTPLKVRSLNKIFIALLSAMSLLAFEYDIKPVKIADSLWCVFGDLKPPTKENKGFVSNVCWVDGKEGVTLLDAGPTEIFGKELEVQILKTTGKKVSTVALTNYHDDRILAAGYFQKQGAKVVAHKNILSDIAKNEAKIMRMRMILPSSLYEGTFIPKIDVTFDADSYALGDMSLLKLSKTAETPSDIAVWLPKQKAIFAGNLVFEGRALNYDDDSRVDGWLEALSKIEKMEPRLIIAGHGTKTDAMGIKETKGYLEAIYKESKKAFDDGVELENLTKRVKASEFSYLTNFEILHPRNLYNIYGQFELGALK